MFGLIFPQELTNIVLQASIIARKKDAATERLKEAMDEVYQLYNLIIKKA
jgi:hypothetical protein